MTRANIVSLALLISGLLMSLTAMVLLRPGGKRIRASLVAGLCVAFGNFLLEAIASHYDIYYVQGLLPVLNSPLCRNIAWVFLGMAFVLCSELTKSMPHPRLSLVLYILIAIIIGLLSDYLGTRWLDFMSLGKNGNWLIIFFIWATLVPATVLVYKIFSRD